MAWLSTRQSWKAFLGLGAVLFLGGPAVQAGQALKANRSVVVRQSSTSDGVLENVGFLAPGAVVQIPPTFIGRHTNDADPTEAALMDWLANTGELRSFRLRDGSVKKDFFFPVQVVEPKGSRGLAAGAMVYAPIRFLSRVKGLRMVVEGDPQMAADAPTEPIVTTSSAAPPPTTAGQVNGRVNAEIAGTPDTGAAPQIAFLPFVQKHLDAVEKASLRNVLSRKDSATLGRNYEATCPGKFADFKREITRVGQERKIPVEILLSIMQIESSGRCRGIRKPATASVNVGLFQINTNSTSIPRCNPGQLQMLRHATTMQQLRDGNVRCLDNPVVNLDEASQILRSKYADVNTQKQPDPGQWDKSTPASHDDWRKALAAYNGGQSYLFQAYNDILNYNQTHGTHLDTYSWENRRVFFFRRVLDRSLDAQNFSNPLKFKRSLRNIMINVAYVDAIAGRETQPAGSRLSLVMQWVDSLYDITRQTVSRR